MTENAASALQLSGKGGWSRAMTPISRCLNCAANHRCSPTPKGKTAEGEQLLVPLAAVVAGEILLTEQGEAAHVFDL